MDLQHGEFTTNDMVRFNIFQAFGNIVVWGLIAPSLDILIYSEPASKVFTKAYSRLFQILSLWGLLEHC